MSDTSNKEQTDNSESQYNFSWKDFRISVSSKRILPLLVGILFIFTVILGVAAIYFGANFYIRIEDIETQIQETPVPATMSQAIVGFPGLPGLSTQTVQQQRSLIDPIFAQCEYLRLNFPQTEDETRTVFGLPPTSAVTLISEYCGATVTGFVVAGTVFVTIPVPLRGCIDNYPVGVSTPTFADINVRVYSGLITASSFSYRAAWCFE